MQQHLSTQTGVESVVQVVSAYGMTETPDGLEFASPADLSSLAVDGIVIPDRLEEFLLDIRLLRRIPLSYLVPDPDLLPPESIRFFHVNQTWVDRVIDGVLSNTTVGTVDFHYSLTVLQMVRAAVDPAPNGMTGMLIRSELARRWPTMIVQAYSDPDADIEAQPDVDVLRAEPLSRDIFIALFAGKPRRVHLREPFDGIRYGVEEPDEGVDAWYVVDHRDEHGAVLDDEIPISARGAEQRRRLDVMALRQSLLPHGLGEPRGVALHLEQRPFVQVFRDTVSESAGSKEPPPDNGLVTLSNGKQFKLQFQPQALFHFAQED